MKDIESRIVESAPDFVISIHSLQERFHIEKWWECPVRYDNGMMVAKSHEDICNGYFGKKETHSYMPSFVLNDGRQMERLDKAIWNAENALAYYNPFWRENGWYIVVSDDISLFPEEQTKDVEKAYEEGGNRVLVLFEHEAENDFDGCLQKINTFAEEFRKSHDMAYSMLDHTGAISEEAIWCLNDPMHYAKMEEGKDAILDEIVAKFQSQEPLMDLNSMEEDFEVFKILNHDDFIHQPCFIGNVTLNNFIRSRMDAYSKTSHRKSLRDLWNDEELMRQVVDYELNKGVGRYHHNRIMANLKFKHSFRTVSNLNQTMVYIHCKPYAKQGEIFFDPCAGWGGRMLGAYLLGMKYVAIDANKKLVEELNDLAKYMGYDAEIYYGDSSDAECVKKALNGRKAGIAFTCPPYWNEEHYSDDEFQSDVKCTGKHDWHEVFFKPMVYNMIDSLLPDGTCVVSVDEKVDWSRIDGIEAVRSNGSWFNSKREDDYYVVRKKITF